MRQAIEEGFILDVLQHYTTYNTYYRLVKAIEDDPKLPKKKATKQLGKFMSLHPHNIEQKTEVMVEHFRLHVKHLLGGKAKAMVVCGSRLHATRYFEAFQRYIKEHGYADVNPMVAFSGKVKDPVSGAEYTEPSLNIDVATGRSISEAQLPERFDSPDYNVLLVANKYQTGFDQPKLHTMYVDKRLDGVQAVQTLSRLNRRFPRKEHPFVLDFVNSADDIYTAFKPFFDVTQLKEESRPEQLEALKHELDGMQVYHLHEVEAYAAIYYQPEHRHKKADHERLVKHIQPAKDRFKSLENDDHQQHFKDKLQAYVNLYAFMSQILPWADADQEKLYSFARELRAHLHIGKKRVQWTLQAMLTFVTTAWSVWVPGPLTSKRATSYRSVDQQRSARARRMTLRYPFPRSWVSSMSVSAPSSRKRTSSFSIKYKPRL
ncbi:MAG: type I restriction endonuclease subunit R [Flavobacteriales bacterium]|nr:MAG: type I restriction endonuclease subunit R [Flavobacteriales bacterium]